jgi:transcriptional regulator with XRE-family HTH domain
MTMDRTVTPLSGRDLEEYGAERIRNDTFEQVRLLWERRKTEGWTQKQVADAIGRDPGWVSRNLSAPGNWTVRTMGAFVQGLNGEIEIRIYAIEDPLETPINYDAYEDYTPEEDEDAMKHPLTIDLAQENKTPYQLLSGYIR